MNNKDVIRPYSVYKKVENIFRKRKPMEMVQLVNPEQQLERARHGKAEILPAEVLYSHKFFENKQEYYQHYSEEAILCVGNEQKNLSLINLE